MSFVSGAQHDNIPTRDGQGENINTVRYHIDKNKEDEMPYWQGGGNSADQAVNTGDEIVEVDLTLGSEDKLQPIPLDPVGENEPNVTQTPSA